MNAEIKMTRNELNFVHSEEENQSCGVDELKEMGVISDECNCSVYSMLSVAGGILLAVGTVVYSLITM